MPPFPGAYGLKRLSAEGGGLVATFLARPRLALLLYDEPDGRQRCHAIQPPRYPKSRRSPQRPCHEAEAAPRPLTLRLRTKGAWRLEPLLPLVPAGSLLQEQAS